MSDAFQYDVFISYSSKEKEWVRGELLPRIEVAGVRTFIDFRDFTRGAPSIKECERGVVESRKTLLVLTPDYIESEWAEIENIMAQTLSPANRDLRMLPLLKSKCDMPLRIGALTYIDFVDDADQDLAWRQLLTALGKPPEPAPTEAPEVEEWFLAHPYAMPPNFTGRKKERAMLSQWLADADGPALLSLRALGGFGKSALTWHWLTHDVDPTEWPRVVWWSFYEGEASFESFLDKTVAYLSGGKTKASGKEALGVFWGMLTMPGTLLVLDGFERALRAFGGLNAAYQGDDEAKTEDHGRDCISPLAEDFLRNAALLPHLRAKVLLTTRLRPRILEARGGGVLEGCREEELTQMQPKDAVAYFRAQGIRGTRAEIEAACAPYGFHPLSLCLLAGYIANDLEQPGDIAAAKRLDVSGELVQRQHHVLEAAYDSLTPERRKLLSRIACFREPVKLEALKALAPDADADLRDLIARGLLHHDTRKGRFDLHPIVRRYAYDHPSFRDRAATHTQLRDYFAAVPPPDEVTSLDDLAPVIELYHHTVQAGQFDEAFELYYYRLAKSVCFQFGASQLIIDLLRLLFPKGEERPPQLKNERTRAWALAALGNAYSTNGQPRCAASLLENSKTIVEKRNNKRDLAAGLMNAADNQSGIGALRDAKENLCRGIALYREIKDEFGEAVGHQYLGHQLAYRGAYDESRTELATALRLFGELGKVYARSVVWGHRALCELLQLRHVTKESVAELGLRPAIESAHLALDLADEQASKDYPIEREYIRAHWLLGATLRIAGESGDAQGHLHEALERCRRINIVEMEADILIDLARLRAQEDNSSEARRLAEEALRITERCGYVLQGADARLELAKLAMAKGEMEEARGHAAEAKRLAACDGPPDYTYRAAYDEALALLAELSD